GVGRAVEEQKVERAIVLDGVRALFVGPQIARPQISQRAAEVTQEFVGELLAIRAASKPLRLGRAGMVGSVVGDREEARRNVDHTFSSVPWGNRGWLEDIAATGARCNLTPIVGSIALGIDAQDDVIRDVELGLVRQNIIEFWHAFSVRILNS